MSYRYESPENIKRPNPYEDEYYENVKERHYLGKYKPDTNDINYKNSKYVPEIESFNLNKNNKSKNNSNFDINLEKHNYEANNKITFAIKSTIL